MFQVVPVRVRCFSPLPVGPAAAAGSRPGWPSGAPVWRRAGQPLPAGIPQLPVHPAAGQRPGRAPTGWRPSARSPGTSPVR